MKLFLISTLTIFSAIAAELPLELQNAENILTERYRLGIKCEDFPSDHYSTFDPVNKVQYSNVIYGPSSLVIWGSYDSWRYVTVYNKIQTKEMRLHNWPAIIEECYDVGSNFGGWSEQVSYSVSLSTSIDMKSLGLPLSISGSVSNGVSYTIKRNAMATEGIEATHVPYYTTSDWVGVTFVETYNFTTGRIGYLKPKWYNSYTYPYSFKLTNQDFTILVKRENVRKCD